MKIIYYRQNENLIPGVQTSKGILPLQNLLEGNEGSSQLKISDIEIINKKLQAQNQPSEYLNENELIVGPCVPSPSKIICVGLNYKRHAIESGMPVPQVPILFTKYNNTLIDYESDVILGKQGVEFDYEVELGVVIGKKCKNVSQEEALSYVLGYCVANDLSCRDLQFKTSQWLLGKSLDGFLPLGKFLVTADEIDDPQELQLTCTLNGEIRQNSNTADMIFSVAEIIEFTSQYMTLMPGDIILTGTPEGVIMGLSEKKWLQPGDVVKVSIEKLGSTENKMI